MFRYDFGHGQHSRDWIRTEEKGREVVSHEIENRETKERVESKIADFTEAAKEAPVVSHILNELKSARPRLPFCALIPVFATH